MRKLDDIDKLGASAMKLKKGARKAPSKAEATYNKAKAEHNRAIVELVWQLVRDVRAHLALKRIAKEQYKLSKLGG